METAIVEPYANVRDKHGAFASIYIHDDDQHIVKYFDNVGHHFFTEEFSGVSPELIEQTVIDWAEGKRKLA
jgi:hypothetical protein